MKNNIVLSIFCLFAATWLGSCDEEDKNVSIVGKWQGDKSEIKAFAGLPIAIYDKTDDNFDEIVEFKDDGTVIAEIDGRQTTGTWAWVEENEKLTATIDLDIDFIDITETYTVKKLSAGELEIYLEKEDTFEDPDTGSSFSGTVKATLFFDRL